MPGDLYGTFMATIFPLLAPFIRRSVGRVDRHSLAPLPSRQPCHCVRRPSVCLSVSNSAVRPRLASSVLLRANTHPLWPSPSSSSSSSSSSRPSDVQRRTCGRATAGGRGRRVRRARGQQDMDRSRRYDILWMKVDQPSPPLSLFPSLFPFLSCSLVAAAQTSSSSFL